MTREAITTRAELPAATLAAAALRSAHQPPRTDPGALVALDGYGPLEVLAAWPDAVRVLDLRTGDRYDLTRAEWLAEAVPSDEDPAHWHDPQSYRPAQEARR